MNNEKYIIVSDDLYDDAKEKLINYGVKIIPTFTSPNVSAYLSKHADMQIVKITDDTFVVCPECYDYYKEVLNDKNVNIIKGETYLKCTYPYDIAYNIVVTKKYAVHNFKYTDLLVKDFLKDKINVNVSQGYCSCTICKVTDDSFITSDDGIYKAFLENNINVLKITNENILLPGFSCGFIGGLTFKTDRHHLFVNGNINFLKDKDRIIDFCKGLDVEIISLSDKEPLDIGSAVLV